MTIDFFYTDTNEIPESLELEQASYIAIFPFLSSNIQFVQSFGVCINPVIPYVRACSYDMDFLN